MTKIKICGITNLEDALVATQSGVDFLGFIFYEPSPRYVEPGLAKVIISAVKAQGSSRPQPAPPQCVGVFVNAPLKKINAIRRDCQLDRLQLHGEEPPEFLTLLQGDAFKAMRPASQTEADTLLKTYLPAVNPVSPPGFLLDAYHPTLYGGTGRVTDWGLAANLAQKYPLMLAGSLTPKNVTEAIQAVQPWGVDVSSGVEAEKGRKDHEKIRAFIEIVRETERVL